MFNALVNVKKDVNIIVQDPDLASIEDLETITNMGIAYEEEYRQAFILQIMQQSSSNSCR